MKRVCVFCGSKAGNSEEFAESTRRLAAHLVDAGYGVVYGGGSVGLMGVLADAVHACQGEIIGVIPEHLATVELMHADVADMRVVTSMHERKALMLELSSAFVALPGGYGTMEELFEVISWQQLRLHPHPVGILNTAGYYDHLASQLDRMVESGFLRLKYRERMVVEVDPVALIDRLESTGF